VATTFVWLRVKVDSLQRIINPKVNKKWKYIYSRKLNFSKNPPFCVCSLLVTDGHKRLEMVTLIIEHYGDSIVGISTGYGTDDQGVGVRVLVGSRIFASTIVQIGSRAHTTSYTMDTGGSFLSVKRPEREDDQSPPTSAEVKKMWFYTSSTPYIFMKQCLIS
jgi:hypothetical protein